MAGHSHWSSIKHKKAAADNKRGRLFSKLAKNIMIAARGGGGNPADNLKLRYAIERARAEFMPKDSIERAIKKGTGELEGGELEELTYEGIGPGGLSIILEVVTDNRNRTGGEIRNLLEKRGGTLGKTGSVTWKFDHTGILELPTETLGEEDLFEIVTEAGATDLAIENGCYRITAPPEKLEGVREGIQAEVDARSEKPARAWGEDEDSTPLFSRHEVSWVPQVYMPLEPDKEKVALELLSLLEDHEDVQNVYCDLDVQDPDEEE